MPQIKTLDRHAVTQMERTRAACLVDVPVKKKVVQKKLATDKEKAEKGFSAGEKDLFREVNKIKKDKEAVEKAERAIYAAYFKKKSYANQPLPVPTKKEENRNKFGQNTEIALVEWEKNQIKPLFKEFDADKKGINKDKFAQIMERLSTDECIIGKVPHVEPEECDSIFENWDTNTDGVLTWEEFREGANKWEWRQVELEKLQEVIDDFFAKSYKFKMQGKDEESKEMATKALRLQGSLTKTKPIEHPPPATGPKIKRGDQFARTVYRREGNIAADDVPLGKTCLQDKTMAHNFSC